MSRTDFLPRIALLAGACVALSVATPAAAGCQSGNSASPPTTELLSSQNCQATASGAGATAVGFETQATAGRSTALGRLAEANAEDSVSIGYRAGDSSHAGHVAVGLAAGVGGGNWAVSVGKSSKGIGDHSVAIGGAQDGSDPTVARGFRSVAIGDKSGTGDSLFVTGFGLGDFGTSIGFNTRTAFAATAVGTDAQAKGDSSTAVGRFANSSAPSALALGQGAVASRARSVALGSSSLANVADTVSVGTNTARRRIVNVANAVANSDAATLGQVKAIATTAAIEAAMSTAVTATRSARTDDTGRELAELRAAVKTLQLKVSELETRNAVAQSQ